MFNFIKNRRSLRDQVDELQKELGQTLTEHHRVKSGSRKRIKELLGENRRLQDNEQRLLVQVAELHAKERERDKNPITQAPDAEGTEVNFWAVKVPLDKDWQRYTVGAICRTEEEAEQQIKALVILGYPVYHRPEQNSLHLGGECGICHKHVRKWPNEEYVRYVNGQCCHKGCLVEMGRALAEVRA